MSHATPQTLLVRGARVEGQDATDLLVKDGVIAETGSGLSHAGEEDLFGFGDAEHPARPAPLPSGRSAERTMSTTCRYPTCQIRPSRPSPRIDCAKR